MGQPDAAPIHPASMMPRHFTEEIDVLSCEGSQSNAASMMPRHFTEEIRPLPGRARRSDQRFNDASAFHRGNPAFFAGPHRRWRHASMMPRHFTEEIRVSA